MQGNEDENVWLGCAKSDLSGLISLTTVQTQADRGRKRKGKLGGLCFLFPFLFCLNSLSPFGGNPHEHYYVVFISLFF